MSHCGSPIEGRAVPRPRLAIHMLHCTAACPRAIAPCADLGAPRGAPATGGTTMPDRRKYYGRTFTYQEWMNGEGLPIHEAVVGVDDVTALPRAPWARTGGLATFVELRGTFQAQRGMY